MELKNFLSNCRNPVFTQDKRGKKIFVPCGKCADCLNKKAVRYTSVTNNASQEFKYCYFVTLKYDEINVPRMQLFEEYDDTLDKTFIRCVDITRRPLKTKGKYKYLKTYGETINYFEKDEHFDDFYEKADITSKLVEKLPFKNLRWCCKEDLQNFIKRLRFRISEVLDSNISYFGVSEYGPQTFRPHFHIILYFNDWRLWQYLREFIIQSWKFGSVRTEHPTSNEGVCSYVSSYLNSVTHLPHYLDSPVVKPRSFRSQFLGTQAYKEIRDFVYSSNGYPFEKVTISTSFGFRDVILTQNLVRALYPRCYNFEFQNAKSCFKLYTIYRELRERYGKLNPMQLSKICYNTHYNSDLIGSFLDCLGIFQDDIFLAELKALVSCDDDDDDLRSTYFNRIYTSILMSKHFLNFVCDNWCDDEINSKISMINDFYEHRDKYLLCEQYRQMQEYEKIYPSKIPTIPRSIQSLIIFADGLSLLEDIERHQLHHYRVFYPISSDVKTNYVKDILKTNFVVRNINVEKDKRYSEKIKHKELNDANLIFVD